MSPRDSRYRAVVRARVNDSGAVTDAWFFGAAPPDSEAVRRAALRWVYRPFISPDGRHAGGAIPVWVYVDGSRSGTPGDVVLLAAPDSIVLARLSRRAEPAGLCGVVRPSPCRVRTITGWAASSGELLGEIELQGTHFLLGDSLRSDVRRILQAAKPKAFGLPVHLRAPPEAAYLARAWWLPRGGNDAGGRMDVLISPVARLLTLRVDDRLLYLDYSSLQVEVGHLIDRIESAARAEDRGP